ncbi:hypothetical protein SLA2020_444760 [Shorea laevis]
MDPPAFCRREGSGSSRHCGNGNTDNCFSLDHPFHQQLYDYIKHQASSVSVSPMIKQGSVHVNIPEQNPEDAMIAKTIETEFHKLENQNGLANSLNGLKVAVIETLENTVAIHSTTTMRVGVCSPTIRP